MMEPLPWATVRGVGRKSWVRTGLLFSRLRFGPVKALSAIRLRPTAGKPDTPCTSGPAHNSHRIALWKGLTHLLIL